jgi:hypothetical protein
MDGAELPPGGWSAAGSVWQPWSPAQAAERLAGVPVPWCVAGGWALDLFRGITTRAHADLEIAVPSAGFSAIQAAVGDLEFHAAAAGRLWPLDSPAFVVTHQTWGQDPVTGAYRVDVFREPHHGGTWLFRRDQRIRRGYSALILHSADGIPCLAPEIALLFKARNPRPVDRDDFAGVLPLLTAAQRTWLTSALQHVQPGHPWLAML